MNCAWTVAKLMAIITLVGILATAPVGACDVRPNKNLTGGAASIRTKDRIAACGHAGENRGDMPRERQDEVLKRYGLPTGAHPDYEVDHLIPLCLGGSDDPSNLWPQPRRRIEKTWNAEAKERLERKICDLVCAGQIDIAAAQESFLIDWIEAYQKYFKGRSIPPPPGPASCTPPGDGNELSCPSDIVVWANLTSKIYHFETSRFYGNTNNGEYMCERDAAAKGMHPAKNGKHPMATSVLAGPFEEAIAAYNRQDYASALQLLRPLAESGNVRAQFLLGFMYEAGMGVLPDDIEAVKWYRRAADTGDDFAQYHMGIMHLNGRGVPRDLVRAYMWLDLAAIRGHQGAAMDRDSLARSMSAAQIAEAQELARKWKPKEP